MLLSAGVFGPDLLEDAAAAVEAGAPGVAQVAPLDRRLVRAEQLQAYVARSRRKHATFKRPGELGSQTPLLSAGLGPRKSCSTTRFARPGLTQLTTSGAMAISRGGAASRALSMV